MDIIRYSLGVRLGAPGPYLILDLYYCATETQRLNVAVNLEAQADSSLKKPDIAADNVQTSLSSAAVGS